MPATRLEPLDYCDYEKVLAMQDACNPSGVELSLRDWFDAVRHNEGPQAMRDHPLLAIATMKLLHVVTGYDCSAEPKFMDYFVECKRKAADIKI